MLHLFSNKLGRWYERMGDMMDLEVSVHIVEKVLDMIPKGHPY
jgi:hypothetical protein